MRRILMMALAPVIAGGCAGADVDGWEGEGESIASSEHAATTAAPRLLRYVQTIDGVSEVRYLAEQPQDGGGKAYLRLAGCREESEVREMFGLRRSAIAEWTGGVDAEWPEIACPDRIATDAGVYAEPRTLGTSLLEYRITGEPPAAGPGRYLVIPNRCAGLMTHLDIPARARRAPAVPLGTPTWTPPAGAAPIRLSCANERPPSTYDGWEVHTAFVPSLGFRTMLLVKKGNTSLFVDSLDGLAYNDAGDGERARQLAGLRALLAVPSASASLDDVVEDEQIEEGHPFFDVCLDRCGDPAWVPAHTVVRDGYVECESGAIDPDTGACAAGARPLEATDRLELDGTTSRRAPLGDVVLDLQICPSSETWERHLGLARRDDGGTWMQRLTAAYNAGKSAAEAPAATSVALPCLVPTRTCTATLRDGTDLSTTTIASLTRSCRAGDEALEIRLGKGAKLTRQAFTIDAAALPAGMRAVRLVGDAARTTVTVSPPICGFGATTACADPQPAIVVQGDLTLDLEHLRLVSSAASTTSAAGAPPAPLARIAVQAAGSSARGLVLRARDVQVVGDTTPAFYKGIVFSGGALALHDSSVRAYTDAVSVDRARVSAVSWPAAGAYALESLAQPGIPSASLVDLRGRWLGGSAANFRALALNADVQAFVVGMRIAGPTAVSWSDDRAVWPEDGLLAVDGDFTSAAGYFDRESVMLSVSGRGRLSFVAPRVTRFGHVLRCPATLSGGTAKITLDRPEFQDITYALRQGACTFESASQWEPTGE